MPHLEFGDKVILPAKVLLELQCFKIPTPLLFQLRPFGRDIDEKEMHLAQYCSVQEFSAPEEHVSSFALYSFSMVPHPDHLLYRRCMFRTG
jgi:hypothetical protein